MKIFAAVIEWPEPMSDSSPTLVLARSIEARSAEIADEIYETAEALTENDWRDAITATGSDDWEQWLDPLELTPYGRPWITTYEREV